MKIKVSTGEIIDKLSILSIKLIKINDSLKLNNIQKEFDYLNNIVLDLLKIEERDLKELMDLNLKLWDIEDAIRVKELNQEFDNEFIEIARKVYLYNDLRYQLKSKFNTKYNSVFFEEKSYKKYE